MLPIDPATYSPPLPVESERSIFEFSREAAEIATFIYVKNSEGEVVPMEAGVPVRVLFEGEFQEEVKGGKRGDGCVRATIPQGSVCVDIDPKSKTLNFLKKLPE